MRDGAVDAQGAPQDVFTPDKLQRIFGLDVSLVAHQGHRLVHPLRASEVGHEPDTSETLGKSFDGRPVLQNISLTLEPGRSLALIGPTAAGKRFCSNVWWGFMRPIREPFALTGQTHRSDTRAETLDDRIGMLFQQNALLTV